MSVPSLFPIAISLNSEIGKLFLEIEPWSRSKPVPVAESTSPCHLDLSAELVGGVAATCGTGGAPGSLDRDRCCPVLAIWLFSAHAHTALSVPSALAREEGLEPRGALTRWAPR